MNSFVHLHLHTEYSLLDGAARIDRLFAACDEKGFPAVAITDHGNMYGVIKFFKKAQEYNEKHRTNIKPIFGCEMYVTADHLAKSGRSAGTLNHLVLLCKDDEGYRNLVKLDSIAFVDGYYYKPRIDFELLKKHSKGLVCMSACLAGEIPRLIMQNDLEGAREVARKYHELFGDDYYIELQDHGIPEQKYVNAELIKISREQGIQLVATNDVHYVDKADSEMQDVLLCIQTLKTIDDPNRMHFATNEFYLKDYEEMSSLFSYVPEALENTVKIAEKCNVEIKFKMDLIPNYVPEDGSTPKEMLRRLAEEGVIRRYGKETPEIRERMDYELSVIDRMGFNDYYLIVWDFINYARSVDIPVGPGRGSGAGSIVAYAVGITSIEPLRYNLLFERFLNPERQSMPDFDIDFCVERRGEVIEYVRRKYGADKVTQIITFSTESYKAAIKDVARVYNVPYQDVDKITKAMVEKGSIAVLFGLAEPKNENKGKPIPELIAMYNEDPTVKKVVDMAIRIENMPRNTGMHAAGVVICKEVISDYIPLQRNGEDITTQVEKEPVEELGCLKMDFLGLRTLTDIKKACDYAYEDHGVKIDFDNCLYDDPGVYELISEGDTDAVFQLESAGMKKLMRDFKPTCLEDVIACISLYRPGPMDSIPKYVEGKYHPERVTYLHPQLEHILNVTYGCMVYQEQVMQVVRDLAGFSYGQSDVIRRAMGKKDLKKMLKMKDLFLYGDPENGVDGAIKRGIDEGVARQLFDDMQKFASYAFNKSHAAAYAVVAYQTAYLKRYYRVEYIAAVLNNRITNIDEIKTYVTYCRENGIEVYPPDLNRSRAVFSVENGGIRFGLGAIKNVGQKPAEAIVETRLGGGEYKSMTDFFSRIPLSVVNKRLVESLIKGGAFDFLGKPRSSMVASYERMLDRAQKDRQQTDSGQLSLFGRGALIEEEIKDDFTVVPKYDNFTKLQLEKEVLGVYVTGHPLSEYKDLLRDTTSTSQLQIVTLEEANTGESADDEASAVRYDTLLDGKKAVMGGILTSVKKMITKRAQQEMAVLRIEDVYGSIEVIVFSKAYEAYRRAIIPDSIVKVFGTLSIREGEAPRLICDRIETLRKEDDVNDDKNVQSGANLEVAESVRRLCLRFSEESYDDIMEILEAYPGKCKVVARVDGRLISIPLTVNECNSLKNELLGVITENDFVFQTVNSKK